jgi:NTE family protein
MNEAAGFLRNVSVFEDLSDELLEHLAGQVNERPVRAGDWVMREGQPAESMFIVRSGRLAVVDEGPPEKLIRILRRGDVLGELALLHEDARSASVRAQRDGDLLELRRDEFEALIRDVPSFALGLTRSIGRQLAASHAPVGGSTPPQTVVVIGLDAGAPVAAVSEELEQALGEYGSVALLSEGELSSLEQAERDAERVVIRGATNPLDRFTELGLQEADLVLAITTGVPDQAWLERASALQGCELLVLGPVVSDSVLEKLSPRQAQVIAEASDRRQAVEVLARRLTGNSLGVVLSGGGARALAHLGAVEELRAVGLQIDRVAGVSMGAIVGAAFAAGYSVEDAYERFQRGLVEKNPSKDYVPPAYSLVRGARVRRLLQDTFGELRIEQLALRFFCLSCDIAGREPVLHRAGPVVGAVYSSMALPGIFPPMAMNGRLLVDGGVLDNLPVETMARTGEGPVIAVDVTGQLGQIRGVQRPRAASLERQMRRALTGSDTEIPRFGETIMRTVTVGSIDTVLAGRKYADLVITPRVGGIGLMDFKTLPKVRELGRDAARAALAANPALARRLGAQA